MRIAVIGDYNPRNRTHLATDQSLYHAAEAISREAEIRWLATDRLENADLDRELFDFDGYWIAPASPYASMQGALQAIRWVREHGKPLVGT